MKKIFISSVLIVTVFLGADSQEKLVLKKYSSDTIDEKIKEELEAKKKLDNCENYINKADEVFDKMANIGINISHSHSNIGNLSLYTNSLMKRYEICLLQNKTTKFK